MIKKCITDQTNPFIIETDHLISYNREEIPKYIEMAKSVSEETGVPQKLIFTPPSLFFLDHWFKIDGDWYFFKGDDYDFHFINELLGEKISEYFHLDTTHYHVAKLCVENQEEEWGLVSKNFCDKKYKYYTAWDYGFSPKSDLSVLEDLRVICHSEEEYKVLLNDMKTFFIRDYYASQLDRSGNNFLFKETPEGIRLAPLYDYESSFHSIDPEKYRNQIAGIFLNNSQTIYLLQHDEKFQELFQHFMKIDMEQLLKQVEEEHSVFIRDDLREHYLKRDQEMKEIVKMNRLIR